MTNTTAAQAIASVDLQAVAARVKRGLLAGSVSADGGDSNGGGVAIGGVELGSRWREGDAFASPEGYGATNTRMLLRMLESMHGIVVEIGRTVEYHGADMRYSIPYSSESWAVTALSCSPVAPDIAHDAAADVVAMAAAWYAQDLDYHGYLDGADELHREIEMGLGLTEGRLDEVLSAAL